jgi:periplasmic divalent cation tolerance protein
MNESSADDGAGTAGVVIVYTTAPNLEEARRIAHALVGARLAACANILPGMTAVFAWQGQVSEAEEVVVILKTTQALAGEVCRDIKQMHSYDEPAALILPVAGGSPSFLDWIGAATRADA